MGTQAATPTPTDRAGAPSERAERRDLVIRIVVGVAAAVLIVLAWKAPIWRSSLDAPQYPGGLALVAYGDRVEGDTREISALNHYVGMKSFDIADFPEMKLWTPTIFAALGAVVVSVIYGKRWPGRAARIAIWLIPIGILLVIQFRLYQYGHDLVTDPRPALKLDPFTPKVIGSTEVLNFTNRALPGLSILLLLGAAALLSFGPAVPGAVGRLGRWLNQPVGGGKEQAPPPGVSGPEPTEP